MITQSNKHSNIFSAHSPTYHYIYTFSAHSPTYHYIYTHHNIYIHIHTELHYDNYNVATTQHSSGIKTLTFSNEECCERATENIHKKSETGKKCS